MDFEAIKLYYNHGLWTKKMVEVSKNKGIITEKQYKEIVGENRHKQGE